MKKFKMNKKTYREYLAQDIFFDMQDAKWGNNGSAIILGKARTQCKTFMNIEVEVLRYWSQLVH
tara:strand:- start:449 stop:640 length:192 start_codon:yes stop_codon:yes gene_type:complete